MDALELSRLKWRARRGMLENDLALAAFFERHGEDLTPAGVSALNELLDLPDGDLWDLISGRASLEAGAAAHLRTVLAQLREDPAPVAPHRPAPH
jgi:antitoxin CptB